MTLVPDAPETSDPNGDIVPPGEHGSASPILLPYSQTVPGTSVSIRNPAAVAAAVAARKSPALHDE